MITNILFALGGSIAGFLVCAFFTAGRIADLGSDDEALAAHARCADSHPSRPPLCIWLGSDPPQ